MNEKVAALTSLTTRQREVLDLACRGKADRDIARRLGISLVYVTTSLSACRKKLGIGGDSHRSLVHWYWTAGPGYTENKVAILQDSLREMAQAYAHAVGKHRQELDSMAPNAKKTTPN